MATRCVAGRGANWILQLVLFAVIAVCPAVAQQVVTYPAPAFKGPAPIIPTQFNETVSSCTGTTTRSFSTGENWLLPLRIQQNLTGDFVVVTLSPPPNVYTLSNGVSEGQGVYPLSAGPVTQGIITQGQTYVLTVSGATLSERFVDSQSLQSFDFQQDIDRNQTNVRTITSTYNIVTGVQVLTWDYEFNETVTSPGCDTQDTGSEIGTASYNFNGTQPPHLTLTISPGLSFPPSNATPMKGSTGVNLANFMVSVVDANTKPVEGYNVSLSSEPDDLSVSGHNHTNRQGEAPAGFFEDSSSQFIDSCVTLSDGTCKGYYGIPEVSGNYRLSATSATDSRVSDSKIVSVIYSGLSSLSPRTWFTFTGAFGTIPTCPGVAGVTSQHASNHFGSAALLPIVESLTFDYNQQTGGVLGVNDMSLIWGGVFDITNNWMPPHNLHRSGTSVDISRLQQDDCQPVHYLALSLIAIKFHMFPVTEPQIHYELR